MYSKNPKAPAFHRLADYQGINMLDGFNISCIWFMLMAHFLVTWAINFHPGKCCVKVDLGPDMFNFVDKPQWYYKKGAGRSHVGHKRRKAQTFGDVLYWINSGPNKDRFWNNWRRSNIIPNTTFHNWAGTIPLHPWTSLYICMGWTHSWTGIRDCISCDRL